MPRQLTHAARLRRTALGLTTVALALLAFRAQRAPAEFQEPFAEFVEPGFPFIASTVDARALGPGFPAENIAARGVVLMLGNDTYATFDPDLLRMAVGWKGDFMSLTTMAQISYREAGNKNNDIPRVLGQPLFANGLYPGWMGAAPEFRDPRTPGPNPEDAGRGPLDPAMARWNGLYVVGDKAVLSYSVLGTEIHEQPGSVRADGEVGIVRTFRTGAVGQPLTLVAAEVGQGTASAVEGSTALVFEGADRDTLTAVALADAPRGTRLQVVDDRYVTVRLPARSRGASFRVVVWRGPAAERQVVRKLVRQPAEMARFERGGPAHWTGAVETRGELAPDTSAYVADRIALPIPNPWRRNVRLADVAFFRDGRAAAVTFDGDVWMIDGLDQDLDRPRWTRFASGLYEPMGIEIVDGRVYVHSRQGIVRLNDLNRDGEADFYENFSDLVHTSIESREFPMGFEARPGGGFYVSKGGALDNGPRTAPQTMPGFRAGSRHSGTVVEVSADGRSVRTFATGLREPFIGVHPRTGLVTASDQQGNFVPSTPLYVLREGGYYGVPATAHREDVPEASEPLVWIPHPVDQSGASQVWVTSGEMGFGKDALIHISYGRPGLFRVYVDSTATGVQGALLPLLGEFTAPLLNGSVHPVDGQLYVTGFQIWGSKAEGVSALHRIRYTGKPSTLPRSVEAGQQGVLLSFDAPLDPTVATDPARYRVQRWNYQRTSKYGSGHYRRDATPGRESLPVASAHLSDDRKSLFLVIPDQQEVMQFEVAYDLRTADGRPVSDTLHLTLNDVEALNLAAAGFGGVDWKGSIARVAAQQAEAPSATASAELGAQVYQRIGCMACHSVDGSTEGKLGPTLRGLYLSHRSFENGSSRRADEEYLRESIREPAKRIVKGYAEGMPSYEGVLSDAEIESLVLYIQSLGTR